MSGLAVEIGMHPSSFDKCKRCRGERLHWPSAETIARILGRTSMSFTEFGRMVDDGAANIVVHRSSCGAAS